MYTFHNINEKQHQVNIKFSILSYLQSEVQKEEKETERNFELDFDIDIGEEREELQMPELSRGKYLHDFKVNVKSVLSFIPLLNIHKQKTMEKILKNK